MSKEADQCFAGGRWTMARNRQFVVSALRRAWMKYPVKGDALTAARREACEETKLVYPQTKFEYQCAVCSKWFRGKEVQVDHIRECASNDMNEFIATLFCEESNLQVVCKGCHSVKTKAARKAKTINIIRTDQEPSVDY